MKRGKIAGILIFCLMVFTVTSCHGRYVFESHGKEISAVVVPVVKDMEVVQATSALQAAGFTVQINYETSADVPAEHVIRTEPEGGAEASEGSAVLIVACVGCALPKKVTVPDVIGMYEQEAMDILNESGCVPVAEYRKDETGMSDGKVIGQQPRQGTIDAGTVVAVIVAKRAGV